MLAAAALLTALALLPGCWSRHELNDLGITLGVGIDKKGDKYSVSAQIVIPEEITAKKSGGGAPATMVEESGVTVSEAFRKMTSSTSRKVYLSHLRILVIGEEVARDGVQFILDFFKRNRELRPDFYVVVARGMKAREALSIMPRLEKVPAERIYRSLAVSEKEWSPTSGVFLDELATNIVTGGREAVLTGLAVAGNPKKGNSLLNTEILSGVTVVKFSSLGVFRKDKLIGWLNEEESKGFNLVMNNVLRTHGWIECPGGGAGFIGVDIVRSKGRIKGAVRKGKPEIFITIMQEESIGEVQCAADLTKSDTIYALEREAERKVKHYVEKMIEKVQSQYRSDIFGFGQAIRRADPKYWKSAERHWSETFAGLEVHVMADIKIRRSGTEGNSFITQLDKKE